MILELLAPKADGGRFEKHRQAAFLGLSLVIPPLSRGSQETPTSLMYQKTQPLLLQPFLLCPSFHFMLFWV